MSLKSSLGLDWFDLVVHTGITAMLMVVASSAVSGTGGDALIALVVASSLAVLAWRRGRALKRVGTSPSERDDARLAELESRLADLEQAQGRMLELEERLDFAERVLVRQREPEASRIGGGGKP